MALIRPRLRLGRLELSAPGMLTLHLALDAAEARCRVRAWDDVVDAYDMGELAAQWVNDFLQPPTGVGPLRLARFDPDQRRLSPLHWTGGIEACTTFSDGFALLVLSRAVLDELNCRWVLQGAAPVGVERFRPYLVVGGVPAHAEDGWQRLEWHAEGVPAQAPAAHLDLVKPCSRCRIPDVDPQRGVPDDVVTAVLRTCRHHERLLGAATFGTNAIVRAGVGQMGHEGMRGLAWPHR